MPAKPVSAEVLQQLRAQWEAAPHSRAFAPLADAYERAGHAEMAVQLLLRGIAQHPNYVAAHVLLAECYERLQRHAEADALFARVLERDPENLNALRNRASRALQTGAAENAAALFGRLREIDPFDPGLEQLQRQLESGALDHQQQPQLPPPPGTMPTHEGSAWADAATPDDVAGRVAGGGAAAAADEFSTLTLARIYESQGYLQKALAIYDDLHRKHPEHAEVAARLESLQRRLAGVDPSADATAEVAPPTPPADADSGWRLMNVDSWVPSAPEPPAAAELAPPSQPAPRQTPPPDAAAADSDGPTANADEDFQRFLRYVRSLRR